MAAFEIDLDDPLNSPLDSIIGVVTPLIPAERHKHLFPEIKVPRTKNFNPDKVSLCCLFAISLVLVTDSS